MENQNLIKYAMNQIPELKIYGRTVAGACPLPIFFNGSGIELNVSGTELWIDLEVDFDVHEPWIVIELNGAFLSRQMVLRGSQSLCVFRGMSPEAVKNVRIIRELQAMTEDDANHLLIHGVKSDGTFYPVPKKALTFEFIGDSITSGEGTYGAMPDMDWLPMYMSYSRGYAKLVSDTLDADFYLFSQGGWGVLCGWDNDPRHNIPSRYEAVCGLCGGEYNKKLGAAEPYDFTERHTDAVIINLGTNDASAFNEAAWHDPETGEVFKLHKHSDGNYHEQDLECFKGAVTNFLKMVRRGNPDAHIIWCYGMLGYDLSLAITDAINRYQAESGDKNTAFLQLPNTTTETVGSRSHPGEKSHIRAAQVLTEYLKDYFGK